MSTPIEHVVVLMLENRSFGHMFAYSGIPNLAEVDTRKTNPTGTGTSASTVPMSDTAANQLRSDPKHEFEDVDWQLYRAARGPASRPINLNGFVDRSGSIAMQCMAAKNLQVLTQLGREYLVCDHWFSSLPGPTWPNRFFVHAGSSGGLSNSPGDLTTVGWLLTTSLGFSFEHGTIYEALEAAGRTWRIYHGDHFPQVCAIDSMPSVFVASVDKFRSIDQFAADAQSGDMADYTFIEPNYSILTSFKSGDSQHPRGTISKGEALIREVYAAVANPKIWEKSLLVITYDEHGGFFDQMIPPSATPPGDAALNPQKAKHPPNPPFAFDQLGIRVPAVIVSPWVKPKSVSQVPYDHTSVIKTVYEIFDLQGHLTARDAAAASLRPLIQSTLQFAAPITLDGTPLEAALAPLDTAPDTGDEDTAALDGFTRIAAQVHHALTTYQLGMEPHVLRAAVAASPEIAALPGLPIAGGKDAQRAYIAQVAALVEGHREMLRAVVPNRP
jgi:phospholipase C